MINPTIIIALTCPTHLTHLIINLKIIMKKEFYHRTALLLLISVLFFACNKGNNKSELCPDGYACCNGPTFFLFYIDKEKVGLISSSKYKSRRQAKEKQKYLKRITSSTIAILRKSMIYSPLLSLPVIKQKERLRIFTPYRHPPSNIPLL